MHIKAGQLVALTTGDHRSELSLLGHRRALFDFDPAAEARMWNAGHPDGMSFDAYLQRRGLLEPLPPGSVVELWFDEGTSKIDFVHVGYAEGDEPPAEPGAEG
ncbi:MAG: hypothetical protein WCK28_00030 [Burkholderiales bacterium]|jgi:hypothetical protein